MNKDLRYRVTLAFYKNELEDGAHSHLEIHSGKLGWQEAVTYVATSVVTYRKSGYSVVGLQIKSLNAAEVFESKELLVESQEVGVYL